jgi:hypothetical protein
MIKNPNAGKLVKYKNGTAIIESIIHSAIVETKFNTDTFKSTSTVKKFMFTRDDYATIKLSSNNQILNVTLKDLQDIKTEEASF